MTSLAQLYLPVTCPISKQRCSAVLITALLACVAFPAPAVVVTLDAIDAGFVTEAGGSAKGDGTLVAGATFNYSVGRELHFVDGSLGMPPGTTPIAPMDRITTTSSSI